MSYIDVINHIQKVLRSCGDPVIISPIGQPILIEHGHVTIEIKKTFIMRQNKCCQIPAPKPICLENPNDKYCVNRIRVSISLADDYSKNYPLSDDEIRNIICSKTLLFGFYED